MTDHVRRRFSDGKRIFPASDDEFGDSAFLVSKDLFIENAWGRTARVGEYSRLSIRLPDLAIITRTSDVAI